PATPVQPASRVRPPKLDLSPVPSAAPRLLPPACPATHPPPRCRGALPSNAGPSSEPRCSAPSPCPMSDGPYRCPHRSCETAACRQPPPESSRSRDRLPCDTRL